MPKFEQLLTTLLEKLQGWILTFIEMLPNLVIAALLLTIGVVSAGWVERGTHSLLERTTGNKPIAQLVSTMARIAVIGLAGFIALGLLNLDKTVTSLLAGVGVVGLALGFAFQDIAANFMSGIIMAMNRPFLLGDYVEVNGHRGKIGEIHLRATMLETLDGLSILVPNRDVFQHAIINFTRTPHRRLEVGVGTSYSDDMPRVRQVVSEAVANLEYREKGRGIEVLFESFGDSAINFKVLIWLDRSDELSYRRARSEAMVAIKAALDREKIKIPFPIRTLDFGAAVVGGERLDNLQLRVARGDAPSDRSAS